MKTWFILLTLLFFSVTTMAVDRPQTLRRQLEEFHRSPSRYMEQLPVKRFKRSPFTAEEIRKGDYLEAKDKFRKNLCRKVGRNRVCPSLKRERNWDAPIEVTSQEIASFIEGGEVIRNLSAMDEFKQSEIKQEPWSDTYWPLYNGALGNRYADPNYPAMNDWLKNFNYAINLNIFDENPKDHLSPSEKYDVLVGDRQKTLTKENWAMGRSYHETYGSVERWMGLCHGWAPASYMLPRPKHSITVKTADGSEEIKFLPSDMKGLATLLWANSNTDTQFLGGRCTDKNPKTDENGRIIDSDCFDTSPGLFHILLVNRIRQSRPFIFDASYDYEVWNQPIKGYSYAYFNPQTLRDERSVREGVVSIAEFSKDKFKKYRSPRTKFVIGIELTLSYLVETQASLEEFNSPSDDSSTEVQYIYDLELDENMNIIGGEWYNTAHPDFVWTPELGSQAQSIADMQISGRWNKNQPIPSGWRSLAVRASKQSQPLAHIVETLLSWAQ